MLQEEEAVDLLESVDQGLREIRHGPLSLLQVDAEMPARVLDILIENFEIEREVVLRSSGATRLRRLDGADGVERPKLKDTPFVSRTIWHRQDADGIFEHIKYRDTLLHHPFDSFATFEAFLDAAVDDEHVVAIKMTLYRVGNKSPLVERLMAAAEAGKQVAVLVELKARFDERSNIGWASRLEEAGVHVVYGLMNLKTHCKLCLVIRKEGDAIQRYVHIGTGNYNRATAQVYTDFGLFTANPRIAADASELFNYLTGYSKQTVYRELIVAPVALRERLTALIEREAEHQRAGRPAGIIIKNNAISDPGIIQVLYGASRAGVPVRAIARGICCLRPGIAGSERHHRGPFDRRPLPRALARLLLRERRQPGRVLGSADLMERNLDRRVETLCPVLDPDIARFIRDTILEAISSTPSARASCAPTASVRSRPTRLRREPASGRAATARITLRSGYADARSIASRAPSRFHRHRSIRRVRSDFIPLSPPVTPPLRLLSSDGPDFTEVPHDIPTALHSSCLPFLHFQPSAARRSIARR